MSGAALPLPAAPGPSLAPPRTGEFTFSDADFAAIARLAAAEFGLHLQPTKKSLIYSRLTRRLRDLGLGSFADYVSLVSGPKGTLEREKMISALTTNVTHFYREAHHFDLFESQVLPVLVARARAGGRVRFWSAGCSSGQEAYSIAASILGQCPEAGRLDLRILATDVDPAVLERAEAGRYPAEECAQLSRPRAEALFGRTSSSEVRPEVRTLVSFGRLNLMHDWPMRRPFDAIFCRNVMIYFDKPVQERLCCRFAQALTPDGWLFIGHSERVSGAAAPLYRTAGITAYRKSTSRGN